MHTLKLEKYTIFFLGSNSLLRSLKGWWNSEVVLRSKEIWSSWLGPCSRHIPRKRNTEFDALVLSPGCPETCDQGFKFVPVLDDIPKPLQWNLGLVSLWLFKPARWLWSTELTEDCTILWGQWPPGHTPRNKWGHGGKEHFWALCPHLESWETELNSDHTSRKLGEPSSEVKSAKTPVMGSLGHLASASLFLEKISSKNQDNNIYLVGKQHEGGDLR